MQRIRSGGTLIVLLHKVGAWDTVQLLYNIQQICEDTIVQTQTKIRN